MELIEFPKPSMIINYKKRGARKIKENKFFRLLSHIMEDPGFSEYYTTYMNTNNDSIVVLIYMHLYHIIKNKYKKKYHMNLTTETIIYMIYTIMTHSTLRPLCIKHIEDELGVKKKDMKYKQLTYDVAKRIDDNYDYRKPYFKHIHYINGEKVHLFRSNSL